MKYFKTEASRKANRYTITKESFILHTNNKFPFEQITSKGTLSQYGICPSCLNPIQLIGISHEIKVSPHGKHTGKNIKGLPEWKQRRYIYCPYAKHSDYVAPNEQDTISDIDKNVIELYNLLKEQFDRAVYVVQNALHIQCSYDFWRKALLSYVNNRVYCYPWLTESNLPYILALRGLQQGNCFGQRFEVNSDVYKAVSKHSNVAWADVQSKDYKMLQNNGNYLKLVFRLYNHQQKAIEGKELRESLHFCIDDNATFKTVFEQKIEFDETFFINIINSDNSEQYRNKKLLSIAAELMPPLV